MTAIDDLSPGDWVTADGVAARFVGPDPLFSDDAIVTIGRENACVKRALIKRRPVRENTDCGILVDIVRPNGKRLRALPWGGRQFLGTGIRRWSGGFEVLDLHPGTLEPFDDAKTYRFANLDDACAYAEYRTSLIAARLADRKDPAEPAVTPIEPPPAAEPPKRTNYAARAASVSITLS